MTNYSYNDVFAQLEQKVSSELNCCMPAVIEKYDHKTQKASVLVDIQKVYRGDAVKMPIIHNLPVMMLSSGGAYIHMPVNKGDTCLVLFCDKDITNWKGGVSNGKPNLERTHNFADGVVIVGLNRFTKPLPVKNNSDVVIEYANTTITIKKEGIVDIVSTKEVNIKTDKIFAECKNSEIKASETVSIECKSASVKASENVSIDCKTASVKATDNVEVNCKNSTITASEKIVATCQNAEIKASAKASINCVNSEVTATEKALINCANAEIKASGTINTETPIFTQKGNLKIEGTLEVTQSAEIKGALATKSGITNTGGNLVSSGKTFETHTHIYQDVVSVITPQGAGTIGKAPASSQTPS
jgi:hypothetical protein